VQTHRCFDYMPCSYRINHTMTQEEASKWKSMVEGTKKEYELLEKLSNDREGVRRAFAELQAERSAYEETSSVGPRPVNFKDPFQIPVGFQGP
jgi:hypothetical protein